MPDSPRSVGRTPKSAAVALGLSRVQPLIARIAKHRDEEIPLAILAREAARSPFHLHRLFSEVTGETPKQFSLRLRLELAAALLLSTGDSVLDIALTCGFQSHETFSRAFRRHFSISPSAYRGRGFTHSITKAQANEHAVAVQQAGPCIGLYHINEEPRYMINTTYSISKQDLTSQHVLVVRRKVARSEIAAAIGGALPHIFVYAQQNGIALSGHPFTRYLDAGPGLITMEPGMRITKPSEGANLVDPEWLKTSGDAEVISDTLPGGPAAVTIHTGPYTTLQDAYAALETWMESQGLAPAGAPWEAYITDPGEVPDPKDWKTEVFWPVRPKSA